jgi:mannose-6-phosphate isomerase-like protein (cupin superfamily)
MWRNNMEIIKCSKIMEFSNTERKYYNLYDVRISDVKIYNKDDVHLYHVHNKVSEILFVLDGTILIKIKENDKTIFTYKVNKNQVAVISAGEKHTVCSIEDTARILVFKYIKNNMNLLEIFLNDFVGDEI